MTLSPAVRSFSKSWTTMLYISVRGASPPNGIIALLDFFAFLVNRLETGSNLDRALIKNYTV